MTVFGVDVSEYQHGLNLLRAHREGAAFVIARATRGPDLYQDPDYRNFKAQARAADLRMPFAAYHFMGDHSMRAEADLIIRTVGPRTPIMLDLEPADRFTTTPTYRQALDLRHRMEAANRRVPLLYYPHWYWDRTGRPTLSDDGWGGLVASAYPRDHEGSLTELYPGKNGEGWTPYGGVTPLIWQYASKVRIPGYTRNTVDGDAFRGTLADLTAANVLRSWLTPVTVEPMATSQNGYPVLATNRTTGSLPRLRKWVIPGQDRHIYLVDGSRGFILAHLALWFAEKINPLKGGTWDEWGWAVRPIRGQTTGYSNHASGTAMDLDATEYPRGVATTKLYTRAEVNAIHERLTIYFGCIRWGGDYSGTPDGMHFEIVRDLSSCEGIARRYLDSPRGKRVLDANPGAREVILS